MPVSDWKPLAVMLVAFAAPFAALLPMLAGSAREVLQSTSSGASESAEPVRLEAAKNERDIEAQQHHSSLLYKSLKSDVEAFADKQQPDEVRKTTLEPLDQYSRALKCGEKIPAESLVVTRGVEIFVRSFSEFETTISSN